MWLRFGDCLFDPEARELRRGGTPVALSPKAFQLLALLVARRPRALSQHELRDELWPDAHVGYTSLAQVVTELRRAIGDRGRPVRLLRTVPRYGYAFAGEVAEEAGGFTPAPVAGVFVADGREYVVAAGETLVGRGEGCGLRLPSTGVSRVHARLAADEREVLVSDAGSKNGTWVNGRRCAGPTALQDGDEVVFGTLRMVFHAAAGSTRSGAPPSSARRTAQR
jgi:DNA-binding winged helix-turn-helix (wHTH) protein